LASIAELHEICLFYAQLADAVTNAFVAFLNRLGVPVLRPDAADG